MKQQHMMIACAAVAGFALWRMAQQRGSLIGTGIPAWDMSEAQRREVGGALWQNDAALAQAFPMQGSIN